MLYTYICTYVFKCMSYSIWSLRKQSTQNYYDCIRNNMVYSIIYKVWWLCNNTKPCAMLPHHIYIGLILTPTLKNCVYTLYVNWPVWTYISTYIRSVGCQMCLRLLAHSVRINHVLSCPTNGAPHTHTQAHDHNVFPDIPYDKLTSTAEYMYGQVHATSLSVNILHITRLTSCTQWLQEATPSTPLPLAKD